MVLEMHRTSTIEWRDREISVAVDGSGPPVVLCHGTPFSSAVWQPIIPYLESDYTVYRWDMPGYGTSSKDRQHAVDLDTQAAALTALVTQHWELDRPAVVAHDIGGAVAARAHLIHGLDMSRLVLVDAVLVQPWGSPFYTLAQQHADVFQELPATMHRALLDVYLDGATHRELSNEELERLAAPWLGSEGQAAFYRQIAQVHRKHTDDLTDRLDTFRCPVQVIWGTEDRWLPIENGRASAAAVGANLIEISDAGHLVQYDQPDQLAECMNQLLKANPPPSS